MTSYPGTPSTSGPARRLRDDLAAVEVDGDLVVYDAETPACHVLAGGAVLVWLALEGATTEGLAERVIQSLETADDDVVDQVSRLVGQFDQLGLLTDDVTDRTELGPPDESDEGTSR